MAFRLLHGFDGAGAIYICGQHYNRYGGAIAAFFQGAGGGFVIGARGLIDYAEGANRIEFTGPARGLPGITVTYTAVLSENGGKLVCDGKTFRITDRPKTIVIDHDGTASEIESE